MSKKKLRKFGIGLMVLGVVIFLSLLNLQVTAETQKEQAIIYTTQTMELAAQQTDIRVWLEAPGTAASGEQITVQLMAENVENLGGFEVTVKHDPQQLALLTAEANPEFTGEGRETLLMSYVPQADGAVLAAASCPVANCNMTDYTEAARSEVGASGKLALATFTYTVRGEGDLVLNIAEVLLVDAAGYGLFGSSQYQADMEVRSAPSADALDLSGNQVVNKADSYLIVSAWQELARDGRCLHETISAYDVNNSGCLNVADVQTVLSAWGASVSSPPADGPQAIDAVLVVTSDQDQGDTSPGDGQCLTSARGCTLRAAIEEANALPGTDTIQFDIRGGDGSCPNLVTIEPSSALTIDAADGAGLTIDGYTQCSASPNSNWVSGNAVIKIEIRGDNDEFVYGLHVLSRNNTIRGLAIYNWHRQIQLLGSSANNNVIEGNFLGTDAANTFTQVAPGIEGEGIRLWLGATQNLIGGTTPAARNIVSGNDQDGVGLQGIGTDANSILNNFVGLSQDGSTRLRNGADGVDVAEGVANNQIGGLNPGERNVISGNNRDGFEISHDVNTQNNHIVGNFIGLNSAGNGTVYNGARGITFEDNVNANQVYRNVIAGNGGDGVRFYTVFNNELYDNFIGVAPTGIGPLGVVPVPGNEAGLIPFPNGTQPQNGWGQSGVFMTGGSQGNSIRTSIIAYHPEYGIYLNTDEGYLDDGTCETYYNTFSQNQIYDNEAQGIRLRSDTCDGSEYSPNDGIIPPQIETGTTSQVTGSTCGNCLVELFIADKTEVNNPGGDNWGEGKSFIAQGLANGNGNFAIPITGIPLGTILTAHATDNDGNTSEFARNIEVVVSPQPTPTNTPVPTPTPVPGSSTDEYIFLPVVIK